MTPAADVRSAVEAANKDFMTTFTRGDATGIAKLYTAEAELLPPNSDVVQGTQAIAAFWGHVITLGVQEVKLETVEVDAQGDTAIETGRYTLVAGGAVADRGKYLVVWKRDGGAWKLHRDIWATSQPAPAPAGA
jgi:uncharacterized protein (TIGR02246 family)